MVSSVTSTPYSYLSQLQGTPAALTTPAVTTSSGSGSSATTTPTSTGNAATNSEALVSSLLGNNASAFTPEVLSLLQPDSSGSFDPITTLLGGTGTNDGLTKLYSDLYNSAESASIQTTKDNNPSQTSAATSSGSGSSTANNSNSVENLINSQVQASVAYNQTLQQNSQSVLNANSLDANGQPLVA